MYRCPTCITVLRDPSSRRCQTCRQRIRRGPRVLGEEHRLGARLLPIDRALNERLHNGGFGPVRKGRPPHGDRWEGRFQVPRAAAAPEELEPMHEPRVDHAPEPAPEPSPAPEAQADSPAQEHAPGYGHASTAFDVIEPANVRAGGDAFVQAVVARRPAFAPLPVEPGPLDPDVQALVDDLYRRARAEIGGEDQPADDAVATSRDDVQPARRRRWVPAVLTDRIRADGAPGGLDGLGVDGVGA